MQTKPHCPSAETENQPHSDNRDYMSLVNLPMPKTCPSMNAHQYSVYKCHWGRWGRNAHDPNVPRTQIWLQLASGAFLLTEQYSECVQIPLDRLKRASPYTCHRSSLSPPFRCSFPSTSTTTSSKPLRGLSHAVSADSSIPALRPRARRYRSSEPTNLILNPKTLGEATPDLFGGVMQADSGRGSETDVCEGFLLEPPDQSDDQQDLEGSSWATAVALAWLEHRYAGFFIEWELVAAKADFWLRSQRLPEGVDLAGLKGAARQLFLLIRHWDENIKLNMLCYNPDSM